MGKKFIKRKKFRLFFKYDMVFKDNRGITQKESL